MSALGMSWRTCRVLVPAVFAVAAAMFLAASPALAAKPGGHEGGGGGHESSGSTATGNDLSYPQCGSAFPSSPAFGIVGVNGGLANDLNPCLGPSSSYPSYSQSELYWAVADSTAATVQPKASLYVNTADPGNSYNGAPVADWPSSGSTPFGACVASGSQGLGEDSLACAWQYGYERATQDVAWLSAASSAIDAQSPAVSVSGSAASYPWWLDVETANTWQSGTAGQAMNVADLQGMVAALQQAGATTIGAYSTAAQWDQVTGGTGEGSGSLYGIPDWVPGAKRLAAAESNCSLTSFTGGRIVITQWSGHPDGDFAC